MDCSWGVLENFPDLPASYTDKVKVLRKQYYPIEIDPALTIEEKTPHMAEVGGGDGHVGSPQML